MPFTPAQPLPRRDGCRGMRRNPRAARAARVTSANPPPLFAATQSCRRSYPHRLGAIDKLVLVNEVAMPGPSAAGWGGFGRPGLGTAASDARSGRTGPFSEEARTGDGLSEGITAMVTPSSPSRASPSLGSVIAAAVTAGRFRWPDPAPPGSPPPSPAAVPGRTRRQPNRPRSRRPVRTGSPTRGSASARTLDDTWRERAGGSTGRAAQWLSGGV
jgi:hypothetical protein